MSVVKTRNNASIVMAVVIVILFIGLGILFSLYTKVKTEKDNTLVVVFISENGNKISDTSLIKGELLEEPSQPVKEGYIFMGWKVNGEQFDFSNPVNENIVLIESWKKEIRSFTIKFDSNGGNTISDKSVIEGEKVSAPSNPTKEGYTFNGWMLDGKKYDFNSAASKDLTLIADWVKKEENKTTTSTTTKPSTTKPSTTKPATKTYTISISKVDEYSPDRILKVYENGKKISVKSISYSDGTYLCSGSNTTVSASDISGEKSFIVTLSNGTKVTAKVK